MDLLQNTLKIKLSLLNWVKYQITKITLKFQIRTEEQTIILHFLENPYLRITH